MTWLFGEVKFYVPKDLIKIVRLFLAANDRLPGNKGILHKSHFVFAVKSVANRASDLVPRHLDLIVKAFKVIKMRITLAV